ncbi:sulfite exporter TauE/SafE family protein [Pseudoroseicyclus tamaricis]|uniref:Probable membrane transporter protein n=1 Tax=Pseudoroseicyclus tamaricis TaxID=2705421 RepID=A0A6B2K0N6_9RHOB|nr:sulfite exporter TauE/SafE family protein [Pseudoroseicyclus tamaricis]NDV02509.1 sulfite exporter TauE/SafE family protein [Pseudoroseicyclus tamaricis]
MFWPDVLTPSLFALACLVAFGAGVVKGISGFAMPMLMISGLSLILPPELALAGLIPPTLATNGLQALRLGPRAAWANLRRFRLYMAALLVMLLISAQLVSVLRPEWLYLMIGGPVLLFALLMLAGWSPRLREQARLPAMLVGGLSGFVGGLSGVWGPPTVLYLTAIDLPKRDHVQVQGVIYGVGAIMLFGAHVGSGLLTWATLPFGLALTIPAVAAMRLGQQVQDRIDQKTFRRVILVVLLVAGANLIRRALAG